QTYFFSLGCTNHSNEPSQSKIVFSKGFHDLKSHFHRAKTLQRNTLCALASTEFRKGLLTP
ncbi:MAG: hypothetical protein J6B28_04425, partial [Eubacterium sp.]|nr:hypothetical protein [Eubacterium sp.]